MDKKLPIFFIVTILLVSVVYGLTALSVSSTSFSSNDPDLDGQAWLVTFALRGDQQFDGIVKAKDIKSDDGKRAEKDLKISAQAVKNSCNYDIRDVGDPDVHQYSVTQTKGVLGKDLNVEKGKCTSKSNYYWVFQVANYYVGSLYLSGDVYCITRDRVAVPATIQSPIENFEAQLSVTVDGKTSTGKISSIESGSVNIPPVAYATWVGSFTSGERCPEIAAQGYMGMNDKTGNWILSKSIVYSDYRSRLNNFEDGEKRLAERMNSRSLGLIASSDKTLIDEYVNQVNLINQKAADTQVGFSYSTNSGAKAQVSGTINSGKINIDLNRQLSTPVITMKVDADVLGVFIPVGKPEISSLTSSSFTEGLDGSIKATIKNVGTIASSFDVVTSCESPFSVSSTVRSTPVLNPSQNTEINIPITAQTEEASEGICSVSAYDSDKPQDKVTKTVKVKVTCMKICDAGETRCNGQNKEKCTSGGCSWEDLGYSAECQNLCGADIDCDDGDPCTVDKCSRSTCTYTAPLLKTKECSGGDKLPQYELICDDSIDNDNDGLRDKKDPDCQKNCEEFRNKIFGISFMPSFLDFNYTQCKLENSPIFWIFTIGIGILVSAMLFLILRNKFGKKDVVINSIISVVAGILCSILFFYFALAAIIVGVIVLIFFFINLIRGG